MPEGRDGGGGDGDAALLFLVHVVSGRRAIVHLAHTVNAPGEVQHTLGGGCLASVNMGNDANIADQIQVQGMLGSSGFLSHDE